MSIINPDADQAEYRAARDRNDLRRHPRSPVVMEHQTAIDIDMSGILRMSPQEAEDACASWGASV